MSSKEQSIFLVENSCLIPATKDDDLADSMIDFQTSSNNYKKIFQVGLRRYNLGSLEAEL